MSTEISSDVWRHSKQKGSRLLLLAALADYANAEGWCWPGIKSLCQRTRMSERYVQQMISEIVADGELIVKERVGSSNYYRVTITQKGGVLPDAPPLPNAERGAAERGGGVLPDAPRTVSRTVSESLKKASPKAERFQKPVKAEVTDYGQDLSLCQADAEAFYDYQESKGWKVGNSPMKDWKAAMRTWKRNAEKFAPKSFQKPNPSRPVSDPDAVWRDDILLLCNEHKRGEKHDAAYVEKKFEKALRYVKKLTLADYLAEQVGQIPEPWCSIQTRLTPGEGSGK